jgi:hypothetical protein
LNEINKRWNRLSKAALIAAIVHFIAGLFMAIVLRQGLDTAELSDRLAFLTQHQFLWNMGWFAWNLAALAILYFYFCFADAHENVSNEKNWLLKLAVLLATAGVGIDFCAEAIEIGVLPHLAQMSLIHSGSFATTSVELFLSMHRAALMMTGCMANELYTISAAMLIFATRTHYDWLVKLFGIGLVIGGFWLSIACLYNSITGMFLSNLLLLPMLILWQLGIAYESNKKAKLA